ncbi:uncharacterized protein LOC110855279 [Folsomia candida]|nr:uncharacterized protein LOC110855279 [Folsomia candida]
MDTQVSQRVNKLYQQLNVLQEFIELKFGSDYKEFQKFKAANPTKVKMVVEVDSSNLNFDPRPNQSLLPHWDNNVAGDEGDVKVEIVTRDDDDDDDDDDGDEDDLAVGQDPLINSGPSIIYGNNCSPGTSAANNLSLLGPYNADEMDNYKQVLMWHIESSQQLSDLVCDVNAKNYVEAATASTLIKEFVGKLVQIKGDSPSSREQKLFAMAIVEIIPAWRYPGTPDGIDILYDEVNRSGLIQAKLRNIHKSMKSNNRTAEPPRKRSIVDSGGPKAKKPAKVVEELPPMPTTDFQPLIQQLNAACPQTGFLEIKKLMSETLAHRNHLRRTNNDAILKLYPKFKHCNFLVNFEFSLLFQDASHKFLQIWPKFAKRLLDHVKQIKQTPAMAKFFATEADKWDESILALLTLLQFIPPAAQGKGKGGRAKIEDARDLVVTFYPTGTPYHSILDTWKAEKTQPNLVCMGTSTSTISSYFIISDRTMIPIEATTSTEAIDTLFKTHYVFAAEYDKNLVGLWKFIQVYIYQLDVTTTNLPRKVKEVFAQLSGYMGTE